MPSMLPTTKELSVESVTVQVGDIYPLNTLSALVTLALEQVFCGITRTFFKQLL